VDLWI